LAIGITHKPQVVSSDPDDGARVAQGRDGDDQFVPRPRADDDEIDQLLAAVQLDDPVSYKSLWLFPVSLRRDYADFDPITFDEAVEKGVLVAEEVGSGEVNTVRVRNSGKRFVFIMAGEIMTGSKQDRTAQRDILVPPKSEWVSVPVYCVEEGRWTVVTPQFGTKRALAAPALRGHAYGGAAQDRIWQEVEEVAKAQEVPQTESKAFQAIYADPRVRDHVDDYAQGLKLPRGQRTVGFVAFRGASVIGADLFGSPAVFDELRDKLIKSYALAIRRGEVLGADDRPSPREAARFLARAWSENCTRTHVHTPGSGESYRLHCTRYDTGGGALVYSDDVVHLSLFPQMRVLPMPEEESVPVPRQ
jgi:hypothetical protein